MYTCLDAFLFVCGCVHNVSSGSILARNSDWLINNNPVFRGEAPVIGHVTINVQDMF